MQGFKKSLVALLAVAMVLSLVGPVFAAVPKDVQGTKYEDAAVRLIALGVFKGDDKGNFNPEDPITRAEAVAVIIRALGLEKSADLMNGVTKFADVNADAGLQWATGAINVAVSSSIVNGYPDGNFGGRDNVTYAQLAKMILYALNYGVTVEGGVWPTAVLAKADDLDILDGLTVVADAPITRGDAAKMLDNSLDVKSLRQTGYGDLKQYEETGDTMLEKLGLDELEARVVAIPVSDSGLKDDELKLEVTKENGDDLKKDGIYTDVYTQIEAVDAQSFFGLEVTAWVNDDDEIVFVEKKTSDNDVYADTIKEIKSGDKVKLQVADTDLRVAKDATIYVNYDEVDYDDLYPGLYGRFVKKNNEVAFAVLFDFEDEYRGGVVTKVDGEKIKYFTTSDKEKTLDLKDADETYIYDATLTAIDVEDIEKDNVIYWYEDDDEYFIVVAAKKVEGKLEKIKDNKLTIDGKSYTFEVGTKTFEDEEYPYSYATYSLNEDEDVEEYKKIVKDIEDLDGEEVIGLLDLKNYVRHLRGATDKTSGTQYGVVVGAPNDDEVKIFTKTGEEVKCTIEKRADYGRFEDMKFYGIYNDDNDNRRLSYAVLPYEITAKNEVAESDDKDYVGIKYAVDVTYDEDGKVDADVDSKYNQYAGYLYKEDDQEFVNLGSSTGNKFYVDKDTVVIRTLDGEELDPEVIKWEDFKDLDIDGDNDNSYAVVFGKVGKTADAIFFVQYDFQGWSADKYFAVVLDKPYYSGGDWKVDLDVFEVGEKTYVCKDKPEFGEGKMISFKLNAKGQIEKVTVADAVGTVDDKYIEDNKSGKYYKIHSDAVIYQLDDGDIDRELSLGDIDEKVVVYAEDKGVAKVVTYEKAKKVDPKPVEKGFVTYVNEEEGLIEVDGEVLELDKRVRLVDEDGNTLGIGPKEVAAQLEKDMQVKLDEKDGVVTKIALVGTKPGDDDDDDDKDVIVSFDAKVTDFFGGAVVITGSVEVAEGKEVTAVKVNGTALEVTEDEAGVYSFEGFVEKADSYKAVITVDGEAYQRTF